MQRPISICSLGSVSGKEAPELWQLVLAAMPPDGKIFLDALCGIGLLRKQGDKYANGVFAARCLTRGGAISLLPAYEAWDIWGGLASALITGKRPTMQKPFVSNRSKAERLLRSLDLDAREIALHLIEQLPLSHARTLLAELSQPTSKIANISLARVRKAA